MDITPELVDKAGLKVIGDVRKLSIFEAKDYLAKMDIFSEEEIDALVTLCTKHTPMQVREHAMDYFAKRRRAFVILWMLGASWGQIADLYQISRQTVMQATRRKAMELGGKIVAKASLDSISAYNTMYWNNVKSVSQMGIVEAAQWILQFTEVE